MQSRHLHWRDLFSSKVYQSYVSVHFYSIDICIGDAVKGTGVYHVLEAIVPLYVAMILGYLSVKCWKIFTPDECTGINTFVSRFSLPLIAFRVIAANNPYKMNLKLILSDTLQKILALILLAVFSKRSSIRSLDFVITGFSLTTLPNTLIIGIPVLKSMYGDEAAALLAQMVAFQIIIWYNLLLFLLEFRAARTVSSVSTAPLETIEELEEATQQTQLSVEEEAKDGPPRVNTKRILLTVWGKLKINPNTHATIIGLIWSMTSFRWGLKLPMMVENSIWILANGGLGMAMFSLGIFMASQSSILACKTWLAFLSMVARFLLGPGLMAVASFALGIRNTLLKIAIVQAALPEGVVPFVFAKEYNVQPNILSTAITLGMIITIPATLAYYLLLQL